jgi:hypothetical protein
MPIENEMFPLSGLLLGFSSEIGKFPPVPLPPSRRERRCAILGRLERSIRFPNDSKRGRRSWHSRGNRIMRRVSFSFLLSAFAAAYQAQTFSPERPVWSICELFEDLTSHGGKIVAVRGLLYQGKEVFALGGRCQSKFVTRYQTLPTLPGIPDVTSEYVWPTTINLTFSSSPTPNGEIVPTFSTDFDSVQRVLAFIRKRRPDPRKEDVDVFVTVTGMLRVRSHYIIGQLPNGKPSGAGYGHLNIDPAQLVILRMSDPAINARKPDDK